MLAARRRRSGVDIHSMLHIVRSRASAPNPLDDRAGHGRARWCRRNRGLWCRLRHRWSSAAPSSKSPSSSCDVGSGSVPTAHVHKHALRTEHGRHPNPPPLLAWVTLACASCLAVLPLLAVASSSVLIRGPSVDGWVELSDGIGAGSVGSGLRWSLVHAVVTLGLGLPLAWCLAVRSSTSNEAAGQCGLARCGQRPTNRAQSIGLGILVAVVWLHPPLLQAWWLASWAHLLLSMPFAVRVLLGGFRRLDPNFTSLGRCRLTHGGVGGASPCR